MKPVIGLLLIGLLSTSAQAEQQGTVGSKSQGQATITVIIAPRIQVDQDHLTKTGKIQVEKNFDGPVEVQTIEQTNPRTGRKYRVQVVVPAL